MMWEGETAHISDYSLRLAFDDAQRSGARLLVVMQEDGFWEYTLRANSEENLLRQIRERGLRPNAKAWELKRVFNVRSECNAQLAMTPAQTIAQNLSAEGRAAYDRYAALNAERAATPVKRSWVSKLING